MVSDQLMPRTKQLLTQKFSARTIDKTSNTFVVGDTVSVSLNYCCHSELFSLSFRAVGVAEFAKQIVEESPSSLYRDEKQGDPSTIRYANCPTGTAQDDSKDIACGVYSQDDINRIVRREPCSFNFPLSTDR